METNLRYQVEKRKLDSIVTFIQDHFYIKLFSALLFIFHRKYSLVDPFVIMLGRQINVTIVPKSGCCMVKSVESGAGFPYPEYAIFIPRTSERCYLVHLIFRGF